MVREILLSRDPRLYENSEKMKRGMRALDNNISNAAV